MLSSQGTARKRETRAQPRDNTEAPALAPGWACSRHTGCELRVPLCSWHFPFFPGSYWEPTPCQVSACISEPAEDVGGDLQATVRPGHT